MAPPACSVSVKRRRSEFLHRVRHIRDFHAEPQIRLVGSIAGHRVRIAHFGKRAEDALVRHHRGNQAGDHALHHCENIVAFDKRHLKIQLREFRLAVAPQILVAHAAGDLKIFLVAGHHQKLLELLRALRQRIKFAALHPAGNHIIPRAFRSRFDQHRRLDFQKSLLIQIIADELDRLVAQNEVPLKPRPPKIQIPVFQSRRFVGFIAVVVNRHRHRLGRIQNGDRLRQDFNFAARQIGIRGPFGPWPHRSRDLEDIFAPGLFRNAVGFAHTRIRRHLDQAGPVAQIDENQTSVISSALQPARKIHRFADIR